MPVSFKFVRLNVKCQKHCECEMFKPLLWQLFHLKAPRDPQRVFANIQLYEGEKKDNLKKSVADKPTPSKSLPEPSSVRINLDDVI